MEVPSKASFKNWPHRPGQQIRTFIMAGVYVSYLLGTKGTSLIFFPSPNLLFCLNSLISPPSLVLTSHDPALRKHPGLSVAGPIPEHQGQELTSDRNLSPLHLGFHLSTRGGGSIDPARFVRSGGGRSQRPGQGEGFFVAGVTVAVGSDSAPKPPCYISRSVHRHWEVGSS